MKLWGYLFVAATALWPAGAQGAEIGRIRAHLVYEETGRLSEDILAQPDFVAWNTIIGEGAFPQGKVHLFDAQSGRRM